MRLPFLSAEQSTKNSDPEVLMMHDAIRKTADTAKRPAALIGSWPIFRQAPASEKKSNKGKRAQHAWNPSFCHGSQPGRFPGMYHGSRGPTATLCFRRYSRR